MTRTTKPIIALCALIPICAVLAAYSTLKYEQRQYVGFVQCGFEFSSDKVIKDIRLKDIGNIDEGKETAICWKGLLTAHIDEVDGSPQAAARRDTSQIEKDDFHGTDNTGMRAGFSAPYDGRAL